MILRLSIILISSGILYAKDPIVAEKKSPISLLPNGSVLKGVLLPRYDKNQVLVGDLKAETMTLIDSERIEGDDVLIQFYNPDRSLKGKAKLQNALFNQATSRLYAYEPVEITNDKLVAKGNGLIYAFQNGQGFLIGPATTWISSPSEPPTSMRNKTTRNAALLALSLSTSVIDAKPPANVSEAELAGIKSEAATTELKLKSLNRSTKATLAEDSTAAKKASEAASSFLGESNIKAISTNIAGKAAPLEVTPGPDDTVIKCDGGMYFDAEDGVLVYMKNVSVIDPRFTLSGVDELKVFFEKKETANNDTTKSDKKPKNARPAANFSNVKKIIATGTVRLLQKSVDGKAPVEASGGLFTYNVQTGEIIISGRYPWVMQGAFYARAKQPNLTLRLLTDGSFSTQGNWEMGGNLNLKSR